MKKGLLILAGILAVGPLWMWFTLYTTLVSPAKEAVRGIEPTAEEIDYWQSPAETRARGAGDCEDFAILIAEKYYKEGLPFRMAIIDLGDSKHMVLQVGAYYIDSVRPRLMLVSRNPPIWTCDYEYLQRKLNGI